MAPKLKRVPALPKVTPVQLTDGALTRVDGSWSPRQQAARTASKMQQTRQSMEEMKSTMRAVIQASTSNAPKPGSGIEAARAMIAARASATPGILGSGVSAAVTSASVPDSKDIPLLSNIPTPGFHITSMLKSGGGSKMFAGPSGNFGNTISPAASSAIGQSQEHAQATLRDLQSQIDGMKQSMRHVAMTGAPMPRFHGFKGGGGVGRGAGDIKSKDGTSDGSNASASASGSVPDGSTQANSVATELSSDTVMQSLQKLTTLLSQTQNLMGIMPAISTQLQSLRLDDHYPADWSMSAVQRDDMGSDEHAEYKNEYYTACWEKAHANALWLSANDSVGQ